MKATPGLPRTSSTTAASVCAAAGHTHPTTLAAKAITAVAFMFRPRKARFAPMLARWGETGKNTLRECDVLHTRIPSQLQLHSGVHCWHQAADPARLLHVR